MRRPSPLRHLAAAVGLTLALVGAFVRPLAAQPVTTTARAGWRVGGLVNAVDRRGSTVYLGGNFRGVAPEGNGSGNMLLVAGDTGQLLGPFPEFGGSVNAVEPDGAGGWFVGGNFLDATDGTPQLRQRLAHVLSSGHLDPSWTPAADGFVRALELVPGVGLFVGGDFSTISGSARPRVALLNAATGAVQPWTYDVGGTTPSVSALAYDGGALFIGGFFSTIDGLARNNSVAVSATVSGQVGPNLGTAGGSVNAITVAAPGSLYFGGAFLTLKNQTRLRLGRVTHTAGQLDITLDAWNPGADAAVNAIAVASNGTVFAGGSFVTVAAASRQGLAQFDASGTLLPFSASGGAGVSSLATAGDSLYVAGPFEFIANGIRSSVAAFAISSGALTSWSPDVAGTASVVAAAGTQVAIGGTMAGYGAASRLHLAAADVQTGQLLPWQPEVNGVVNELIVDGAVVYIGGAFTQVSNTPRPGLAAVDSRTGALLPWNPAVNGAVSAMVADATHLYIGGSFTIAGGQNRPLLARIAKATGALDATFAPSISNAGGTPQDLVLSSGTLYVGGGSMTIGGATTRVAALDAASGARLGAFAPNVNGDLTRMDVDAGFVYLAGFFTQVDGQPRTFLAKLDAASGAVQPFAPQLALDAQMLAAGFVAGANDIDARGGVAVISGAFATVNGATRLGVAQVDTATGATTGWAPDLGQAPGGFGGPLLVAADFTVVGGARIQLPDNRLNGLALFVDALTPLPLPPTGFTATVAGNAVTLTWAPSAVGVPTAGYVLEAGSREGLADIGRLALGNVTQFAAGGIPAGTYWVRLRAITSVGPSAPTPDFAFTIGGSGCTSPPAPPAGPLVQITGSRVQFFWAAGNGTPVTSFELQAGTSSRASNLARLNVGLTDQLDVPNVPPGNYYIRLAARNGCGVSATSAEALVTVGNVLAPPAPPVALLGTATSGAISLSWQAPGGTVTGYVLEAGTAIATSNLAALPLAGTAFAVSGVPAGTYFFRVRAVNGAGTSAPSNDVLLVVP